MSPTLLAYDLPDPALSPVVAQGGTFSDFHDRIFTIPLHTQGAHLVAGRPRLLFTGPRAMGIGLFSVLGDWLVYDQYSASSLTEPWTLAARNLTTGRVVTIDTSAREGVPGGAPTAASDGHTVVWQSRTLLHNEITTIIHSYNLDTSRGRVLAQGGSPTTWQYDWPAISGRYVVFEKDTPARQTAQILFADLSTGQVHPLTPAAEANSEPAISGDVVTWKRGWRYAGGDGVVIYNRRTGTRRTLAGAGIEAPKATAGRYVVYPIGQTNQPLQVHAYDVSMGTWTNVSGSGPTPDGYQPGNVVLAGERAVLYWLSKNSATTTPNPTRLVVTLLP